jgi:hypothetical protein
MVAMQIAHTGRIGTMNARGTIFSAIAAVLTVISADLLPAQAQTRLAQASSPSAEQCAKGLPAESRLIYDASVKKLGGSASLRDVVTAQTRSLVFAGQVRQSTARSSAEAAGKCLQLAEKG